MSAVGGAGASWYRPLAYAAGTVSMLVLATAASLALWIVLPWVVLGWSPTLVTSGSMTPLVVPGDVVLIRHVPTADLTPRTVVLYDRPDTGPVLHRIVATLPDGTFRTRGDANTSPDSAPVRASDIRGVAVLAVPWVGWPSLWVHQGRMLSVALVGAALLVLLALAPRSLDPVFDPWAGARRVHPVVVLRARPSAGADLGSPDNGPDDGRLLPVAVHDLVLRRLSAQHRAAASRTASRTALRSEDLA